MVTGNGVIIQIRWFWHNGMCSKMVYCATQRILNKTICIASSTVYVNIIDRKQKSINYSSTSANKQSAHPGKRNRDKTPPPLKRRSDTMFYHDDNICPRTISCKIVNPQIDIEILLLQPNHQIEQTSYSQVPSTQNVSSKPANSIQNSLPTPSS